MIFHGGRAISEGCFFNLETWKFETISRDGGYLPGGQQVRYIRIPAPLMFVTGPLEGLAYAILLPPFMCVAFFYVLFRWGTRNGEGLR